MDPAVKGANSNTKHPYIDQMTAPENTEGVTTKKPKAGISASTQGSTHPCNKAVSQTARNFICNNNTLSLSITFNL